MSELLHLSEDGSAAIGRINGEYFAITNNTTKLGAVKQTVNIDKENRGRYKYSIWGDDNKWPQNLVETCKKSDLINPIIRWKTKRIYSHGLVYGTLQYKEVNGETVEVLKPIRDPEIEAGLKRTNIKRYLREAAHDLTKFGNVFTQLLMGKDYKNAAHVSGIYAHDATECRLGKQDLKTGKINECLISAVWGDKSEPDEKEMQRLPVLDPYYDVVDQVKEQKKPNYILPTRALIDGHKYYQVPDWYGIIESGWLKLAEEIPRFKAALMNNMIFPKWHIEVHKNYWPQTFADWQSKTLKEKKAIYQSEYKRFLDQLSTSSKAGSVIMTTYDYDKESKQEYSLWKVKPIETSNQDGSFLADSQEADFHIIRAFGIPPVLIGVNEKGGLGAGSGSKERISEINYQLSLKDELDLLLEPLDIVSEINGWNDKYKNEGGLIWWTKQYYAATLDLGDKPKSNDNAN